MIPLARIAVWALSLGAVVLIALILGGSDDLQEKVGAAALLFVLFSLNSLSGFFLIERRPELTLLGASAIGFSVAAYFVVLDTSFSRGFPGQNSVWILVIIAFVLGQASLLLSFRRDEDSPLVTAVLAGALIVLALLVVLAIVAISGTEIGPKAYATLAVLYLLGALLPPCLRWEEVEAT
jgi:hypothetical protein